MEPVLSEVADPTFVTNWGSPPTEVIPPRRLPSEEVKSLPFICLDAAALGDIPARYTITCVQEHELPAIGVYIDPKIALGFKYRVRILPDLEECEHRGKAGKSHVLKYLFSGQCLRLQSIGRGYCRRMVFEPSKGHLNDNDNYFWTDSHPGGFALELSVITEGDTFCVIDENQTPVGLVEVFETMGPQLEISETMSSEAVTKSVSVKFHCRAEGTDGKSSETSFTTVSGIVECVKRKGSSAAVVHKIHSLKISGKIVDGLLLIPIKDK